MKRNHGKVKMFKSIIAEVWQVIINKTFVIFIFFEYTLFIFWFFTYDYGFDIKQIVI